ncbi:MAG: hypothetical protein ACREFK_14310 [Stellaceae bacterium]
MRVAELMRRDFVLLHRDDSVDRAGRPLGLLSRRAVERLSAPDAGV